MLLRLVGQAISCFPPRRLSPQGTPSVFAQVECVLAHDRQPGRVSQLPETFEITQRIEPPLKMRGQFLKRGDIRIRFGWDVDVVAPASELANALSELQVSPGIEIGGQGLRRSILPSGRPSAGSYTYSKIRNGP